MCDVEIIWLFELGFQMGVCYMVSIKVKEVY